VDEKVATTCSTVNIFETAECSGHTFGTPCVHAWRKYLRNGVALCGSIDQLRVCYGFLYKYVGVSGREYYYM